MGRGGGKARVGGKDTDDLTGAGVVGYGTGELATMVEIGGVGSGVGGEGKSGGECGEGKVGEGWCEMKS